jgi:hypothetical protein
MKKNNWFAMAGLLVAGHVSAATFEAKTLGGFAFTLETTDERVTGKTSEFDLCGENVSGVRKVKLWMPGHNHGSTPVQVGDVSEGCRKLTRVNFSMPGKWEVRLELEGGDYGAFEVPVERQ